MVGWTGNIEGELTRETVASHLVGLAQEQGVHRVIVAMPDRRGTLPVEELLDMRLAGVKSGRSDLVAGEDLRANRSGTSVSELADFRRRLSLQRLLPAGAPGAEFLGGIDWAGDLPSSAAVHLCWR